MNTQKTKEKKNYNEEDIIKIANLYKVDIQKEPFLLNILEQALENYLIQFNSDLINTNITEDKEIQSLNSSSFDANSTNVYYQDLINKERLKNHSSNINQENSIDFQDSNGAAYRNNFMSCKSTFQSKVFNAKIKSKETNTMNTSKKRLDILNFSSWWTETTGDFSMKKRLVDINFHISSQSFQIILDKSDKVYSLSHIIGTNGALEAWDLYLGAKIDILGRKTTLMKANAATTQWLEEQVKLLLQVKKQIEKEAKKYKIEKSRQRKEQSILENACITPTVSKANISPRALINDIYYYHKILVQYRPDLANKLVQQISL